MSNPPCGRLVATVTALGRVPVLAPGELTYYSGRGPATNDSDLCGTQNNLCHCFDQPDLTFGRSEIKTITPVEKLISSR